MIVTNTALAMIEKSHSNMPIEHLDRIVAICDVLQSELVETSESYKNYFSHPGDKENFLEAVQYHDIGKALIEQAVINKTSAISEDDYELMKSHVMGGLEEVDRAIHQGHITGERRIKFIRECILYHHERWDGTGYPQGAREIDIPHSARILAIADTYDSAMSPRPWKDALSTTEIYEYIVSESGISFDPAAVVAFKKTHDVIEELYPQEPKRVMAQ